MFANQGQLTVYKRLLSSFIFSLSAIFPVLIVGLGRKLDNSTAFAVYLIAPAVCALISAYILSPRIRFDEKRIANGLIYSLMISALIVVLSLFFWIIPAAIIFNPGEKIGALGIAIMAGTVYGWATYPPGLLAGIIVWAISKHNKTVNPVRYAHSDAEKRRPLA